jgi:hypothetical protein
MEIDYRKLVNSDYNGKWHSVTGSVYQRHDTREEAQKVVDKFGGEVVRGDVHDLEVKNKENL